MKSNADCRSLRGAPAGARVLLGLAYACAAAALMAQADKPAGDKLEWQKHLDELAKRTEQTQTGGAPRGGGPASPLSAASAGAGLQRAELFEDDFDRTSVVSYIQHRVVLLVFSPQVEIDSWRRDSGLRTWADRAVICAVNEGSLGTRAQRLARAFGVDPLQGGVVAALVRAPDGVKQVAGDQLLYQVLGRFPAPRDAFDVLKILQQAAAAYDAKKSQYAWDATVTGADLPGAPQSTASSPAATGAPAPVAVAPGVPPVPADAAAPATPSRVSPMAAAPAPPKEVKPPAPARSAFEAVATRAWQTQRALMLIFPGKEPFDVAKCAAGWKTIPAALAPELLVLSPGSADGDVAGKAVDWEAFFDVNGQYPTTVLVMPEAEDKDTAPRVQDMSFRVIARRQGALTAESAPVLARLWVSEDFDAVVMRAWVLRRPMLMVFPHPEHERDLLESPVLAKIEERLPVFINTRDSVSGIRRKTAETLEKEHATQAVERAEIVLLRLETKVKDPASVRLDQIQLTPINRAFAKKTPDKILDWVASRVPPKPARSEAGSEDRAGEPPY